MTARSISEELIGTWHLTGYEARESTGPVRHPLGRDAAGLLIYGADGYMSVQIMRLDRRSHRRDATDGDRVAQLAASAEGYLAYAGRYEVEKAGAIVVHHVEFSLVPNWVGRPRRRSVELRAEGAMAHRGDGLAGGGASARVAAGCADTRRQLNGGSHLSQFGHRPARPQLRGPLQRLLKRA